MTVDDGYFATCHSQDNNAVKVPMRHMTADVGRFPEIYEPVFMTPAGEQFPQIFKDGEPYSADPPQIW